MADWIVTASGLVTAVATLVLGYVTWVLARETKTLSAATSQAHVTFTIEPNAWAVNHVDLIAANSGNAVAYDVEVSFDPPLPSGNTGPSHRSNLGIPLRHISILRPGQTMQSNLAEFKHVSQKKFRVTVTWKHHPAGKQQYALSYDLNMDDYHNVSYLGARFPAVQLAEQVKKLREDVHNIATGSHRVGVDIYTENDRKRHQQDLDEWFDSNRQTADEVDTGNSEQHQSTVEVTEPQSAWIKRAKVKHPSPPKS